jgi:hypothetical protein
MDMIARSNGLCIVGRLETVYLEPEGTRPVGSMENGWRESA